MEASFVVAILVLAAILIWKRKWKFANLPRGPRGWPLIGNLLEMDKESPHLSLMKWARRHGDIYSISLLGKPVVVVSGYELMHEGLVKRSDDFAGRPNSVRAMITADNEEHVTFIGFSPRWQQIKRISMTSLKMYGSGLQTLEDISLDILQELVKKWEGYGGKAVDILPDMHASLANIIMSIVFGRNLDESCLQGVLWFEREAVRLVTPSGPGAELELFPWLRFLGNKAYKELDGMQKTFGVILGKEIENRRSLYEPGNPGCVLDALWDNQSKELDEQGKPIPTDSCIRILLREYVVGGITTTSATLYSYFAIMAAHPEIQERLHTEISQVLGKRLPHLADRGRMPYLEASILETLRYISPGPLGVPHLTTCDTRLGEYVLPKSTEVWFNFWYLHHDAKNWGDPWDFRVERFLDQDGHLLPVDHDTRKRLMPFSAGRRVCLGETLARNRLFLIIAMLLQRFSFQTPEGEPPPDIDPRNCTFGLALKVPQYKVRMLPRET